MEELEKIIQKAEHSAEQIKTQLLEKGKGIKDLEIELENDRQELQMLADTGELQEKLRHEIERLSEKIQKIKQIKAKQKDLTERQSEAREAQKQYLAADEAYKKEKQVYERMDQAYRDGQAGLLASRLVEDMPCPVCGSLSHPKVAELSSEVPHEEDLKRRKCRASELMKM